MNNRMNDSTIFLGRPCVYKVYSQEHWTKMDNRSARPVGDSAVNHLCTSCEICIAFNRTDDEGKTSWMQNQFQHLTVCWPTNLICFHLFITTTASRTLVFLNKFYLNVVDNVNSQNMAIIHVWI